MQKIIRFFGRLISLAGDAQTVMLVVPNALISALAMYLGHIAGESGHWVIFAGMGVFCFGMIGFMAVRQNHRWNRLKYKLDVSDVKLLQQSTQTSQAAFRPVIFIQNSAGYELAYNLISANYTFGLERNSLDPTIKLSGFIPANSVIPVGLPGFNSAPPIEQGKIKIEVLYGHDFDSLNYKFSTSLDCYVADYLPPHTGGELNCMRSIVELEYKPVNKAK